MTQKPAMANLEMALSVVWRSGRVNNTRVPSALDIYNGRTDKIAVLIQEVFDVYVVRELNKVAQPMMLWYNGILAQYRRPLRKTSLFAPHESIWEEFQTGTLIFCSAYVESSQVFEPRIRDS